MTTTRKLRIRITRLLCLFTAVVAALAIPAQAAFAQVAPADPNVVGAATTPTVIVTHAGANSGLAVWIVAIVVVAAVAVGAGLRELVRTLAQRRPVRRLATTQSS